MTKDREIHVERVLVDGHEAEITYVADATVGAPPAGSVLADPGGHVHLPDTPAAIPVGPPRFAIERVSPGESVMYRGCRVASATLVPPPGQLATLEITGGELADPIVVEALVEGSVTVDLAKDPGYELGRLYVGDRIVSDLAALRVGDPDNGFMEATLRGRTMLCTEQDIDARAGAVTYRFREERAGGAHRNEVGPAPADPARLMTARELGEMLIAAGDRPVKLLLRDLDGETFESEGIPAITMVERGAVLTLSENASGTEWGDIAEVLQLEIRLIDNA